MRIAFGPGFNLLLQEYPPAGVDASGTLGDDVPRKVLITPNVTQQGGMPARDQGPCPSS